MDRKHNILQYRERMDNTLRSHDLANEDRLRTLIKDQILRSSHCDVHEHIDSVVETRTKDVSDLIGMLRSNSASEDELPTPSKATRGGWKVKQDTQEYRVLYREGAEGTPFHTFLVEGYVNGPVDVCLCISTESTLYKKWWPQFHVPTFKVISSDCLQKIGIGEHISSVRMKVSWPLSSREAVVHYFTLEYFEDDMVIVLLKSITDMESIDRSTHGFSKDEIPEARDVVRIDLVGGFALQKVSADRSYFRTISNMDIKLDFVPPAFINFISRQLVGSGFRLYQKEVASVRKGDKDFGRALKDPLYTRIREALYPDNISKGTVEPEDIKIGTSILPEESMETIPAEVRDMAEKGLSSDHATHSAPGPEAAFHQKALGEIEEIQDEEIQESAYLKEHNKKVYKPPTNQIVAKSHVRNRKGTISPEVEQALGTLEKVISYFCEYEFYPKTRSMFDFSNENFINLEMDTAKDLVSSENRQICSSAGDCVEVPNNKSKERTSHEPRNSSCSHDSRRIAPNSNGREANNNKIAPASPGEDDSYLTGTHQTSIFASTKMTETSTSEKITNGEKLVNINVNEVDDNSLTKRKSTKLRFCCSNFPSGRGMA